MIYLLTKPIEPMNRGKQICRILRDIRCRIAEENDIELITSECQYKGECSGTCPKCEAELRYLEQALERRRLAGKAISLLGLSAGLFASFPSSAAVNETGKRLPETMSPLVVHDSIMVDDIIVVRGKVVNRLGQPFPEVIVRIQGTSLGMLTDTTGCFALSMPAGDTLQFSYFGYKTREVKVDRNVLDLLVVMDEEIFSMADLPDVLVKGAAPSVRKHVFTAGMFAVQKVEEDGKGILVQGIIVDKEGNPLPEVEILQVTKDSSELIGQTDNEGKFEVYVVLKGKHFKVAKEGYRTRRVRIGRGKNPEDLRIVLKPKCSTIRADRSAYSH